MNLEQVKSDLADDLASREMWRVSYMHVEWLVEEVERLRALLAREAS